MADSDDESERQRSRDKFRRERSDYDGRRRPGDKREPFEDKSAVHNYADRNNLDGPSINRDKSSPVEPAHKRPRRAYNDDYRSKRDLKNTDHIEDEDFYRPPLIPFKRFLDPLDDLITEEEACSKYKDYKESYTKRHIEEFFEAHKNEEWLRLRYHPDHMPARKEALNASLRHRLTVFMDLFEKGFFDNQSVQMDNSENLIRMMDAVVIKLEGGTDDDLKLLDSSDRNRFSEDEEDEIQQACPARSVTEHKSEEGEAESELDADSETENTPHPNRTSGSPSRDGSEKCHSNKHADSSPERGTVEDTDRDIQVSNGHLDAPTDLANVTDEDAPTPTTAEPPEPSKTSAEMAQNSTTVSLTESGVSGQSFENVNPKSGEKIRKYPLHRTLSIFFRSIPTSVTETELKEICSSQPGFLRLVMWDPVPERRFTRHAWATYKPYVNIKKICWTLNTSPLFREKITSGNGELVATVNRELAQRVRPLTPLTRHRPIMKNDLLLAAQLIARLDAEHRLWDFDAETGIEPSGFDSKVLLEMALKSENPVLKSVREHLIQESGGEEKHVFADGDHAAEESSNHTSRFTPVILESDPVLARALDYLIIYLRVVHSVDYYAGTNYPMEDAMPHRCGILHARGDRGLNPTLTGNRPVGLVFNQREITDHLRNFEQKIRALIDIPAPLTDEEMKKLGMRDPEKVAEQFVEANIQKRTGKKKPFKVVWVCPLSDKKFCEPIFVRKHIFNKHMDKVENAKKDNAIFFNNYLRDPRRPCLPEAPYHLMQHYYGNSQSGSANYKGSRSIGGRPAPYRGPYRSHNSGGNYSRGGFQDYYDVATQQQQQQAMAAVAAAAAAALYPNAASEFYNLAAGSRSGPRRAGGPLNSPPGDYNARAFDVRRRQNFARATNRRAPHPDGRGMVSYNDLDDPGSE